MTDKNTFYITTPIYYVNDRPHIGHAYTTLACDVLARFHRLTGKEVYFLTGTDEHGQKVEKSAEKKGVAPQAFTDEVSAWFRELVCDPLKADGGANLLGFSNDDFIRTTEPRHKKGAQAFWEILEKNGHIYLDKYAGWYSVRDEAFYAESELIDGKAPTGADVEWVEEESYFFRLSAFEDKLLQLYRDNPSFIQPEARYNEVVSFVKGGLKDLSISRTTFRWGVPVPNNPKHVMYVWLDALTNYITALGFPDTNAPLYNTFWPADIHMVGKDIVRFHAVYWPAFLMGAELPVMHKVVAHGWWTNEGQKISKSLGNVIDPLQLKDEFGLDALRYFLMREVPFGNDGNYSRTSMINRMNAELSNTIGNLAQRSLSMVAKHLEGRVPENKPSAADQALLARFYTDGKTNDGPCVPEILKAIEQCHFSVALTQIVALAGLCNEYIDTEAPWKLRKDNPERMQTVLYVLAEASRCIAILLQPFVPESAKKLLQQLGYSTKSVEQGVPLSALQKTYALEAGTLLPAPEGVFPRFTEAAEEKRA